MIDLIDLLEQPWVVPVLGVSLVVLGVAMLVLVALRRRWERQSGTSRLGGGVYRSAHAAGRRIGGRW